MSANPSVYCYSWMTHCGDNNVPRVLLLLVNDSPNLLVPKAKSRNTNNISYYYLYSENVPNHLLIYNMCTLYFVQYSYNLYLPMIPIRNGSSVIQFGLNLQLHRYIGK